jgi:hypothetical protein
VVLEGGMMEAPVLLNFERMVFEAEGWGIIVIDDIYTAYTSPYASHKICESDDEHAIWGYRAWDLKSERKACQYCKEAVPECIVTLVMIEGWKR